MAVSPGGRDGVNVCTMDGVADGGGREGVNEEDACFPEDEEEDVAVVYDFCAAVGGTGTPACLMTGA